MLDLAGTERLSEIHSLSREVEELRMKADLVKELRERVDELEQELIKKQAEASRAWCVCAAGFLVLGWVRGS